MAAFHVAVILACGKEKFCQRGPLFFAEGHDFVVNIPFGRRVGHTHEPAVEFLVLLGESGCGKSTTLNTIGGMLKADSGSIRFDNQEIIGLNDKELTNYRRYNIGFIFQSYNLMPSLTAKQNLDLIAELVSDPMDSKSALKTLS